MASNDLFRMVSLRHSRAARREGQPAPGPDPRLRYGRILEARAATEATPQSRKLRELKAQHARLTEKAARLETVQRAVIDTFMRERQDRPAPKAVRRAEAAAAREAAAEAGSAAMPAMDRARLEESVVARVGEAEAELFREVLARIPAETRIDLPEVVDRFAGTAVAYDANGVCAQIQAVEDDLSEDLPTVPAQPVPEGEPIVAAVGWGDLLVARETLVGYDAREIAHIENILPGETKLREHQRLSRTEEVQESETVTERETEKDSQTTDRYELQVESQQTISSDFSISAGVNTSGQYGLTHVDTSLDAGFSRSESESRSSSIDTAREIVTKAVERTFERVRRLRRLTLTEEIREFNRHKLANTEGSPAPAAVSGIYLWVEKIQKVELRHYGARMMVEFHVPEPALSLHERRTASVVRRRLPPFAVSPSGIHPGNYMCLAQRYGALDVQPPPTLYIEVGYGWVSKLNEDDEQWGEDQFTSMISVPAGYRPTWAKVAWSGLKGKEENRSFNFSFSVGGRSQGIEHTVVTYDGVVLQLPAAADWPQGVPVSGRVHGSWDGAMYVQVTLSCMRTSEALDAWRLATWQALRAGYEALERKLAQDEQQQAYQRSLLGIDPAEAPAAENRRIERAELQKWAIKSMRLVPQNFNAVEQVGEFQEISPVHADAQAPVVRFYEDAFEWAHMTWFLYPYHWARRASWRMRAAATAVDPQHRAFLEAGAARVIVPVTPGFEDKVAWFLDPSNAAAGELERILSQPLGTPPASGNEAFQDLWVEILTERRPELARGAGTLAVENGSARVTVNPPANPDSRWRVSAQRDPGRQLHIAGDVYAVAAVVDDSAFDLDRPYAGTTDPEAAYVADSTPFGPPWTVNVPTSLVVLSDNVAALKAL
ncbi:MAG: hypothetical protein WD270_02730 [Acetobacterales bacterium]